MTEINKNNKKKSIPALIGSELLLNIKTKWIGFFIGLIAMALTIVAMVYYRDILPELYHGGVIVAGIVGCALFVDVDPLVVAGDVGEGVDGVLVHRQPLGGAELLADERLELVDAVDCAHVVLL